MISKSKAQEVRPVVRRPYVPFRPFRRAGDVPTMEFHKIHTTEPQIITCPRCGSSDTMKYGVRNGTQNYICRKCRAKFTAKQNPYKMRFPADQIGAALGMFYDGLSLSAISHQMQQSYGNYTNPSSIYRWVLRYTQKAIDALGKLRANASHTWVVDETMINIGGKKLWFWDIIDRGDSRFLLASHLSRVRTIRDVTTIMTQAAERAMQPPRYIISDGMRAYPDGIERVFGADAQHILSQGFTEELNTNLIERFHGTIKQRTKVLRGFKSIESARLILGGFVIHYNFFRPHMTLQGKTPAEAAGIESPLKNWTDVVRQ